MEKIYGKDSANRTIMNFRPNIPQTKAEMVLNEFTEKGIRYYENPDKTKRWVADIYDKIFLVPKTLIKPKKIAGNGTGKIHGIVRRTRREGKKNHAIN